MLDTEAEKHESFGQISISRVSSTPAVSLYGSPSKHRHTIRVVIRRSEKHRSLSNTSYFGRKVLTEVELSENQFAQMITSLNMGDGVPCTLRHIADKQMASCPEEHERETFKGKLICEGNL